MTPWEIPARLWTVARKVEGLLELQDQTKAALQSIDQRFRTLEERMTRIEAGQAQVIVEARAAAGIAATGLASAVVSDIVTRVTRLEM